jgi:hypothetical protein
MEPVVGQLRLATVGGIYQLAIYAPGDNSFAHPLLPVLYNARVVTMHGDGQLWHGEHRADDAGRTTVMQEWSVKLGVKAPTPEQMRRWGAG